MTNTVEMATIKNRDGAFKKNNGQWGLNIPTIKNKIVHKAKSNAAIIIIFTY
jgi:retron-type reverse transcriptase